MINASRIFYAYFFLFLSDECQAIAQRQDDYFYPRVVGNQVIECSDALGLMVTVVGWVDDVPVPQRIVCQNISARIQNLHHLNICRSKIGLHFFVYSLNYLLIGCKFNKKKRIKSTNEEKTAFLPAFFL